MTASKGEIPVTANNSNKALGKENIADLVNKETSKKESKSQSAKKSKEILPNENAKIRKKEKRKKLSGNS